MTGVRIGVDIGGTFTDVALEVSGELSSSKVLTDYTAPEEGILRGIEVATERAGVKPSDITQVIHGTTLVTNALIQRRGAKTAFITTEGFRDVIEMRSENRFEQYDLNLELPKPLVPRQDRFTVSERVAADGSVLKPLTQDDMDAAVSFIRAGAYEAVAIGFMHAYANSTHEEKMADALGQAIPDLSISMSSVISPQMRELPRFNTVVANAFVQPQVADYLARLEKRLQEYGISAPLYMFHSGGGLISVETAQQQPVRLLESGPAGGAIFAAGYARAHGVGKALSFDMGGTTAKICLIEDGAPTTASSFEIARTYRFKKGSGMTVSTPVVEMVEIGAGGGSIASIDKLGRLQVGPSSAGSEPGPACYQRGGDQPTVTDANLTLGRLDAENFAGGAIPLSVDASKSAIDVQLGSAGLSVSDAAFGVTEMVDENMANAARVHTVEHGQDIEKYTMIAFGGGAPLHASRLCEKLGVDRLIVPPGAGVGSAIGFLRAPFSYEATRGKFLKLSDFRAEVVNAVVEELEDEAQSFMVGDTGGQPTEKRLTVFMRYSGQGWEIPVVFDKTRFEDDDANQFARAFEATYERLFGRIIDGLEVEITNWALTVSTIAPPVHRVAEPSQSKSAERARDRSMFDAALRSDVTASEVHRAALIAGDVIDGPAIITEDETSTIVTSAFRVVSQSDGALLIERKGVDA